MQVRVGIMTAEKVHPGTLKLSRPWITHRHHCTAAPNSRNIHLPTSTGPSELAEPAKSRNENDILAEAD
jgi:hypothetical protein